MKLQIKFIVFLILLATTCKNLTILTTDARDDEIPLLRNLFEVVKDPTRFLELVPLLKIVADRKVNLNAIEHETGKTILHYAAETSCHYVASLLGWRDHIPEYYGRVDADIQDFEGKTPLDLCPAQPPLCGKTHLRTLILRMATTQKIGDAYDGLSQRAHNGWINDLDGHGIHLRMELNQSLCNCPGGFLLQDAMHCLNRYRYLTHSPSFSDKIMHDGCTGGIDNKKRQFKYWNARGFIPGILNDRDEYNLQITVLHRAAAKSDYELVKLLLKYGADVNPIDAMGATPLDRAADQKCQKLLKKCGGKNMQVIPMLPPTPTAPEEFTD